MVDYKGIPRLTSMEYSLRQTAVSAGHPHHAIKNILELAEKRKVKRSIYEDVTNDKLERLLYP